MDRARCEGGGLDCEAAELGLLGWHCSREGRSVPAPGAPQSATSASGAQRPRVYVTFAGRSDTTPGHWLAGRSCFIATALVPHFARRVAGNLIERCVCVCPCSVAPIISDGMGIQYHPGQIVTL